MDVDAEKRAQREALRAKLRAKKNQRLGGGRTEGSGAGLAQTRSSAQTMLNDPTTALLSMGIDDPAILSQAGGIVQAAKAVAKGGGGSRRGGSLEEKLSRLGRDIKDGPDPSSSVKGDRLDEIASRPVAERGEERPADSIDGGDDGDDEEDEAPPPIA